MELAEKMAKRSMQSDRLLFYIIGLSAVLLSQTFLQIVISFACMVALLVWLWLIQRRVFAFRDLARSGQGYKKSAKTDS